MCVCMCVCGYSTKDGRYPVGDPVDAQEDERPLEPMPAPPEPEDEPAQEQVMPEDEPAQEQVMPTSNDPPIP